MVEPRAGEAAATIAVLPFDSPSGDPDQDYFARGFVEDVATELSRFPTLEVIHPRTSFALAGAAPAGEGATTSLRGGYLLCGSVRRVGDVTREFSVRDLSDFDRTAEPAAFDVVTSFYAIHDQARPLAVLEGIRRTLKADGVYLMQDIAGSSHVHKDIEHPLGPFLYTISCMHCMTVSLAQGGEGLGAMWGEDKTRQYLTRAGFRSIETHRLAHDVQNNWYVVRK